MRKSFPGALGILFGSCLGLSACGQQNAEQLAQVQHNFNGSYELYSYRLKPSEELGQAEALAKKTYGQILRNVRSPLTMFACTWRNTNFKVLSDGRPSAIFLACVFGPSPIKRPKSLLKLAQLYNSVDRANLKATWTYENGDYVLSRFEVEILANKKSYRSQNLKEDMPYIEVQQENMTFPKNKASAFHFSLRSQLPQRRNSKEAQSEPIVSVSFSGIAEPMPSWVNY